MKVFTYIFAAYITLLSVVVCSDGIEPCQEFVQVQNSLVEDKHEHSEDHQDHCTPFCSCACCGTVITLSEPDEKIQVQSKAPISSVISYRFDYSFDFKEGTWHPPATS